MSKRFQGKTCIYCLAAPSIRIGDHLFAREFFPKDKRDNLPKVPGCDRCNNEKSKLEHYLTTVLPFGARHGDASDNLTNMVPRRLAKNQKLHRALDAGREKVLSEEQPGVHVETSSLPFNTESLHQLMAYIVKGLLWHHWEVTLPDEFDVRVVSLTTSVEPMFADLFRQNAANRVATNLGDGAFVYDGAQGTDYPEFSVWSFSLFGGLKTIGDPEAPREESARLFAITAKKSFLPRFDALVA